MYRNYGKIKTTELRGENTPSWCHQTQQLCIIQLWLSEPYLRSPLFIITGSGAEVFRLSR